MFSRLADAATGWMVRHGAVEEGDREVYQYGVYLLLSSCLHVVTVVAVGLLFGRLLEALLFYLCYAVLRKFAGGIHADTSVRCYACSCLIAVLVMAFLRFVPETATLIASAVFLAVGDLAVFFLSPVDCFAKPLDEEEVSHYRRTARVILGVENVVVILLVALGFHSPACAAALSVFVLAVMLVMGRAKNRRSR